MKGICARCCDGDDDPVDVGTWCTYEIIDGKHISYQVDLCKNCEWSMIMTGVDVAFKSEVDRWKGPKVLREEYTKYFE